MAYWIQEYGGKNRADYKMFHCDKEADILKLPRYGIEGTKQDGDISAHKPATYGDQALCLETSAVYELTKDTNTWVEL